jgi:hypothetical protein
LPGSRGMSTSLKGLRQIPLAMNIVDALKKAKMAKGENFASRAYTPRTLASSPISFPIQIDGPALRSLNNIQRPLGLEPCAMCCVLS